MVVTPFRTAMAQIRVDGGQPSANLDRAIAAIEAAATSGCQLVVLPECLDLGWTDPSARTLAQPIPGPHTVRLQDAACAHGIMVAAGLVERASEQLFNSAILIDRTGQIRLHYRKINELDIALDLYSVGDRLGVVETELGTIGLNICADNFRDSLAIGHILGRMGAQVILSPCAWAVDADHEHTTHPYGELWRDAYSDLCRLYPLTILGVSNVGWITGGPWKGRKCIGCSLAMGPDGVILAQGPYGESAESITLVEVRPQSPIAHGTAIAPVLKSRGYEGP